MSQVEEIKNSVNIVDIVSETVRLRRTGKSYIGFCPFHANTHTPAFVVFPDSGTWRCFGACAEGGDVVSFIMKRDGLDFHQAIELLAQRAGIKLEKFQRDGGVKKEKRARLQEMLERAATIYHEQLLRHPSGGEAREFVRRRGVTEETCASWKLGYALGSWDGMTQQLLSLGYSREELIEGGMVSEQRDSNGELIPNGRIYDRFRNRLMIPIREPSGGMIGFGARHLNPDDNPKFLNSPQTVLFDKGRTLFGYDRARTAIRERDQSVIVEGYFDVIILHQAGFTNTVAPMGTALGPNQVRLLTRQSKRILLALDADAAGDSATIKGIDVIRATVKGENSETDLIRQENELKADIRVTKIPEGQDPDEVVLRDAREWEEILARARPIVTFRMETAAAGKNLSDAKVKQEIADEVLPLIEEVANPVERETYRQQLAEFLNVDVRFLISAPRPKKTKSSSAQVAHDPGTGDSSSGFVIIDLGKSILNKETTLIWFALRGFPPPEGLAKIDRCVRSVGLEAISPADFEEARYKEIAALYFEGLNQDFEPDIIRYVGDRLSEDCVPVFQWIQSFKAKEQFENRAELLADTVRQIGVLRRDRTTQDQRAVQSEMNLVPEGATGEEGVSRAYLSELSKDLFFRRKLIDKLLEKRFRGDFDKDFRDQP
ncbi:DNA primase [Anaerolineaceae bacterium oral taxon 439]|nr:DNA primase [Anaerolineaceae bacterium oral taxon 439]